MFSLKQQLPVNVLFSFAGINLWLLCFVLPLPSASLSVQKVCTKLNGTWSPTTFSCFKLYSNFSNRFTMAESHAECQKVAKQHKLKGRLAVIPTIKIFHLLSYPEGSSTTYAWIGMKAAKSARNVSRSENLLKNNWNWYDGNASIMTVSWPETEVEKRFKFDYFRSSLDADCMLMRQEPDKKLYNENCFKIRGRYCEFLDVKQFCNDEAGIWSNSTASCFKFYSGNLNWTDSNTNCQRRAAIRGFRGRLAILPTVDVYNLLSALQQDAWIALKAIKNPHRVWNNHFEFIDWRWFEESSAVLQFTWQYVELKNKTKANNKNFDCVTMNSTTKVLDDTECSDKRGRICEFLNRPGWLESKCTSINGSWFSVTGQCFKHYHAQMTWKDAYCFCERSASAGLRGRLPIIDSKDSLLHIGTYYSSWTAIRTEYIPHSTMDNFFSEWKNYEGDKLVGNVTWWHGFHNYSSGVSEGTLQDCIQAYRGFGSRYCLHKRSFYCEYLEGPSNSSYCNSTTTTSASSTSNLIQWNI